MSALLVYNYTVDREMQRVLNMPSPDRKQYATAMEELFKEWQEAADESGDEEFKQALDELRPLRERLTRENAPAAEMLADLNRVEEKLAAARTKLEARSLDPHAAALAAAFDPMKGMSALAAALRRKDFAAAEQLARDSADKLGTPDAKTPEGAQQSAGQMAQLGRQAEERGDGQMAESLSQLNQGAKENNAQRMGEGMRGMQNAFARQNARNQSQQRIASQMRQVGFCKTSIGEGKSMARGMSLMPKLALTKSEEPGKGAGAERDPNRFGAPSELNADRTEEQLTGTASTDGESETTTMKSSDPHREAARGGIAAGFKEYEALSREAVEDENIPLAHREAIKRYFERIRPAEAP